MASIARRILNRMPETVASRVDMMRGFASGADFASQIDKLRLLLRFRREHDQLREALTYYRYTFGLMLALRVGLLDALEDEPRTTAALAERAGTTERAAEMLLRILESQGYAQRIRPDHCNTTPARWRRTEFTRHFLSRAGALSYGPLIDLLGNFGLSLDDIVSGLQNGTVAESLDVFDDDGHVDAFLNAVNSYIDSAGRELVAKIPLPPVGSFICGSMGVSFSALLLHAFPESRVTYGCLEHLVRRIPRLREQYGVNPGRVDGMHSHGGVPADDRWGDEAYDLVFLTKKMVLEPENELGRKFAQKSFDVLNPGGVAVLWEAVHHDDEPTPMALAMESVLDLGVSPTGCLLTRRSMTSMLRRIGFADVDFVPCLGGETNFVVARKN